MPCLYHWLLTYGAAPITSSGGVPIANTMNSYAVAAWRKLSHSFYTLGYFTALLKGKTEEAPGIYAGYLPVPAPNSMLNQRISMENHETPQASSSEIIHLLRRVTTLSEPGEFWETTANGGGDI